MNVPWYVTTKRFQYFYRIYEQTGGDPSRICKQYATGREIGFDTELTDFVVADLRDKGLIMFAKQDQDTVPDFDLKILITEKGIEEIRSAINKPHSPTQYFPAQTIKFASKETKVPPDYPFNSGESGVIADGALVESIHTHVVKKITANIEQFSLESNEKKELLAEVQTIQAQLSSPNPKARIVAYALASVKSILENKKAMSAPAFIIIHNIISALHSLS